MNNAARGVILGLALMGMGAMFFMVIASMPDSDSDFKAADLAGVIFGGFVMLSCAVLGAAALAGMKGSETPPKPVTFPFQQQQQGAVPPQGQPYPQHGTGPQHGVPQQYQPPQ
ncbi:hypothetical protein HUT06_12000 [Actinomadura sp. NAK00032]|uniref:hypothetical protein n=1 Tax=Actinomadura sp. NAK00032 TaxID=2742128 RepID=UPI001591B0F0|nr:hypothetical protein [Actinomadura sp. NAK00032]QKW34661.1 hypothetical protein HUT06_12000 [Actinomadura sp. NAK00032]